MQQQLDHRRTEQEAHGDAPLPLAAGQWVADAASSSISFAVRHLGLSNVRGRFNHFDATIDIGRTLDDISVYAVVDLSSVDTNNAERDNHLRTSDFFDVDTQPSMVFHSTSATRNGGSYLLTGDLTIAGISRTVTFDVEFNGTMSSPVDQSLRAGFSATGQVRRSEFGIDFGLGAAKVVIGDRVRVDIDVQLIAPEGADSPVAA